MSRNTSKKVVGLVLCLFAGIFLAVFSAYPQLKLLYNQEGSWQGHYAYNDIDEVAYASYVKALIDGRPRKNDPYTGRDDRPDDPQPESLFSIQFAAPYTVALPARLLGISAPTAMTLSGVIAAFLSAVISFLFLRGYSENDFAAFAGSLVVLAGGALAAGEGAIGEILGTGFSYPYFPFLRRYLPAVPFPAFLALFFTVWGYARTADPKARFGLLVVASVLFAYLVFSYFYLWTTAAAWLTVLGILLLAARRKEWRKELAGLAVLAAGCITSLLGYFYLLSQRADTLDHVQLLVMTRQPDIFRFPIYVGAAAALILAVGVVAGTVRVSSLRTVFSLSLALTPLVLFNQQIVTGRSLQPIHYQVFVGNYVAGLALVTSVITVLRRPLANHTIAVRALCLGTALLAIFWGVIECHYTVRVLDRANVARDGHLPAAEFLADSGSDESALHKQTIFAVSNIFADDLPTVAPQNVLWARHQHVFAGLSWQESKERYYRYMYFQGLDHTWLESRLKAGDFVVTIALFGWGRHTDRLTVDSSPLTYGEIDEEVGKYREFSERFGPDQAYAPKLEWLALPAGWKFDGSTLGEWYSIGEGRMVGNQVLYKLEPGTDEKEKAAPEGGSP